MEFLEEAVVLAIHDQQIGLYGGLSGVRDSGLLASALARPQNRHAYGESCLFALAASLVYGIARNHPFLDANKRTAWACGRSFLRLNGLSFAPDRAQAVEIMVQLAQGSVSEDAFAHWLRDQAQRGR